MTKPATPKTSDAAAKILAAITKNYDAGMALIEAEHARAFGGLTAGERVQRLGCYCSGNYLAGRNITGPTIANLARVLWSMEKQGLVRVEVKAGVRLYFPADCPETIGMPGVAL